jgi:hypothetical protein
MNTRRVSLIALVLGIFMAIGAPAHAQNAVRSGWVPNVGELADGEFPLGDLWTFNCPTGGSGTLFVDTKDDTDTGQSCVDVTAYVVTDSGTLLGFGDDDAACTYAPVCGFSCPAFSFSGCDGNKVSLVVRDFGTASNTGTFCNKGGGYVIHLAVFDKKGVQLTPAAIGLGGGPSRFTPVWARTALGLPPGADQGPALDDEDVPQPPFGFGARIGGKERRR